MSKTDTLLMETTVISSAKTAGEICAELVRFGASQIVSQYDQGSIVGLNWTMRVLGQERLFSMPVRVEPVYQILLKREKVKPRWYGDASQLATLRAKAERVAWRQLLRWIQAQLAMIDCGMTETTEVFFAYLQTPGGQPIYELFKAQEFKALPPAN